MLSAAPYQPLPRTVELLRRTAVKCSNDDEKLSELVIMHVPICMRGCCDQSNAVEVPKAVGGGRQRRAAVHETRNLETQPQPLSLSLCAPIIARCKNIYAYE